MPFTLRTKDKTFVDVSLAFEPNPLTDDITLLLDDRAINNSLKNIILTSPGEVPFDHDLGSSVRDYLFDIVDEGTAGLLNIEIERAINFNEPRVDIVKLVVDPRPDSNEFMVTIIYKIVGYERTFTLKQILGPTR